MKLRTLAIALSVVTLGLIFSSRANAQKEAPVRKKLIEVGWDMPNTSTVRKNLKQMENTPFDGVILTAEGKDDDGKIVSTRSAFSNVSWKKEWFQSAVNDLKAIHSATLTDNFLCVMNIPGNVDMFDDAGWKEIVNHWSIIAWIAKEGNLKGILFDHEQYNNPQLGYTLQTQRDKHSFTEYQIKARQRGREIINAVASVDPNLVIFTFAMHSINVGAVNSSNPQSSLQSSPYALYPAFINGWLDAAPPTMTFVDGAEDQGYHGNSNLDFLTAANMMRNTALNLVAPENRQKYLAQVQTSFGLYLDAYINPPGSPWYIDPKGTTPTLRLQSNTKYALNAASEYVWVYGEKYRWWDTDNKSVNPESWESVLPDIHNALMSITHPAELAKQQIATMEKNGALTNLLQNGDFSAAAPNTSLPANWGTWQVNEEQGVFALDKSVNHEKSNGGSARITGVKEGVFLQSIKASPGEMYAVRAHMRQIESIGSISIQWQDAKGAWVNEVSNTTIYGVGSAKDNSWQTLESAVTVPSGAEKLVVLLSARDQVNAKDAVWFDDVGVYKIPS